VVQPLTVKIDPRVKTPAAGLQKQFDLSMQCYEDMLKAHEAAEQLRKLRGQLKDLAGKGSVADAVARLDAKAAAFDAPAGKKANGASTPSMPRLAAELAGLLERLQEADATPKATVVAACTQARESLGKLLGQWEELKSRDVMELNDQLRRAKLPPVLLGTKN
jgi:hypothetical protein